MRANQNLSSLLRPLFPSVGTMARKTTKKAVVLPPAIAVDNDVMDQESDHGDADDNDGAAIKNMTKTTSMKQPIPFLDTFFQLSSEESPTDRSVAARDLIQHCLLNEQGVNHKDAAYALTRLMNGMCTGRAASRQGFASCLSSFLRVVYSLSSDDIEGDSSSSSSSSSSTPLDKILKEDASLDGTAYSSAMFIRHKLLSSTQFVASESSGDIVGSKGGGQKGTKKNNYGSKMKDSEKRDHSFGRLFGILAVVRSGILALDGFPSEVVKGYTKDLIDLYNYKMWMREPAAHALIELLSSLDADKDLISQIANEVIIPTLFLSKEKQWLQSITPEQFAIALLLQTPRKGVIKFDHPLDKPLLTDESVPVLYASLASTSFVVYPRCHIVWNTLWVYLKSIESSLIVEKIIQYVVVDVLLGKGEESTTSTHEQRSLALQIICALCGLSDNKFSLPTSLIGSVLRPEVVTGVFLNVLCASGGLGKKNSKEGGGVEHYLKPLTSQALAELVNHCCEENDVDRRVAFAKAFLHADSRFDTRTKTNTVSSLLMLENSASKTTEDTESTRQALWQQYLSFLEDQIVSAASLHNVTAHIDLMYRLAKLDLARAPANDAQRVLQFFMTGAFFDCSRLESPPSAMKGSSKKKKKDIVRTCATPPPELSSGRRIKEILLAKEMACISQPTRVVMSARFYSLVADLVSSINSKNHANRQGSKPESIYRALSEICSISSLLEASGATKFLFQSSPSMDSDDNSEAEDPLETSKKCMLRIQEMANRALVEECDASSKKDSTRANAVITTGCASLMMSLYLQLNNSGTPDVNVDEQEEEDDEDDIVESLHEYISDLAEVVEGFGRVIGGEVISMVDEDKENPLAMAASLLVNILSSPVGGEDSRKTGASKLTRETVKVAWSGILSAITGLIANNRSLIYLVDEDVMSTLVQSVCGEKSLGQEGKGDNDDDNDSIADSSSSEVELGEDTVFADAARAGMNLDEVEVDNSDGSQESDEISQNDMDDDADIELDPAKLKNLLLEDSDAEMSDNGISGILEHHAGADKALAQLIKMRQEARKASQIERDRVDLCTRLRCATLLDSLFTPSVFKSGWLPVEAVLGSIVPILRSYKDIAKSIQAASSTNAKKSLGERNALLERLSELVKNKLSKFRPTDDSNATNELALKASSDIFQELNKSLNASHCSCCSVALTTVLRCIPDAHKSEEVKGIYIKAVKDWSSRKATKIHSCVFDDLINRLPSLAAQVLIEPLVAAAGGTHSPFIKCESIKLLSAIYKQSNNEESMSDESRSEMKKGCSKVAAALMCALSDSTLERTKHRHEILIATRDFVVFLKAQDEGILTDSELASLQESIKVVGGALKKGGLKQMCLQASETINSIAKRFEDEEKTKKHKTNKKQKKK